MPLPSNCPPATAPLPGTIPFPSDTVGSGNTAYDNTATVESYPLQACKDQVLTRQAVTQTLLDFLRFHFSDPVNHGLPPTLRNKIWSPVQEQTKIFIYGEGEITPPGAFPSILIRPGAVKSAGKLSIGNLVSAPFGQSRTYGELRVSHHSVICHGGTIGEAEAISEEVDAAVSAFIPRFRNDLGLVTFNFGQIDEVVKVAGTEDAWYVPIAYTWSYLRATRIIQQAPLIRDTVFNQTAKLN